MSELLVEYEAPVRFVVFLFALAVLQTWEQTGFSNKLGPDHIFPTKRQALHTIIGKLSPEICAQCRVRIFEECASRPGASAHDAVNAVAASSAPRPGACATAAAR